MFRAIKATGVILVILVCCHGCFAYRHRLKQVDAPGGAGEISQIKNTMKAKTTTRDEVLKRLGYLDTGLGSSSFFWGRWVRTSELVFVAVGAPGAGGGGIGGPVSDRPVAENLVVEFDPGGRVVKWNIVDDGGLIEKLVPVLSHVASGPRPQIPPSCTFEWGRLTRVEVGISSRRPQDYDLLQLEFFAKPSTNKANCVADVSPEAAFGIFSYLMSVGLNSVLN